MDHKKSMDYFYHERDKKISKRIEGCMRYALFNSKNKKLLVLSIEFYLYMHVFDNVCINTI